MNLYSVFQDFNPSKFLVYAFLALFSLLFALKLDNYLTCSYWAVFTPLWIWKIISVFGCAFGCVAWIRTLAALSQANASGAAAGHSGSSNYVPSPNPASHSQLSRELVVQFRAMLMSTALNLLLLAFEILLCYNLESNEQTRILWIVVVAPLVLLSITSIGIGVWAIRNGRSFDFEIFCSVNILEFIFVALKLDGFVDWSWIIVFIPLWSVMCIFGIAIIYLLLLICILSRSLDTPPRRYRHQLCIAVGHLAIMPPLLAFEICLALKLDERLPISFTAAVLPLLLSFGILMLMAFTGRGWNIWWFGIRRDFLSCVLTTITPLQEYANISWKLSDCLLGAESDSEEPRSVAPPFGPPMASIYSRSLLFPSHNQANNVDAGSAVTPAMRCLVLDVPE